MVSEGVASSGFGAGCTSWFLVGGSGSCADGGGYCGEGLVSCAVLAAEGGGELWGVDCESCRVEADGDDGDPVAEGKA